MTHNKYQDTGPRLLTPALLSTVWREIAFIHGTVTFINTYETSHPTSESISNELNLRCKLNQTWTFGVPLKVPLKVPLQAPLNTLLKTP